MTSQAARAVRSGKGRFSSPGARGLVALAVGATLFTTISPASAAVPVFPNNLVVFPDRDFVTVEGYQGYVGQTATLTVKRGATTVGSAQSVVGAGDVAFEVNHPGGACWGAGTNLKVTPDIVAGDVVSISFPDGRSDDVTVQDAQVNTDTLRDGNTVTIKGNIAEGVSRTRVEQRIINPDLTGTAVGRRDARALPGPLVASDKGGYQSSLEFVGNTFTATYVFDDEEAATIAATGGGERMMTWQAEDGQGNRQGISIAEYGESGGPGMGGCPAGPAAQDAPAGSFSAVKELGTAQLNWTPAEAAPGAAAVTGYQAVAIDTEGKVFGARVAATATRATIEGLATTGEYTYEVRSLAGPKMSEPFSRVTNAPIPTNPPSDQTQPRLALTPAGGATAAAAVEVDSVTAATDAGSELYYSVGTAAIEGDLPTAAAKLYTGPIAITAPTELHIAAFDRAGNTTETVAHYKPVAPANVGLLAAPGNVRAVPADLSAEVRWDAVAGATGYRVTPTTAAFGTTPAAKGTPVEVAGNMLVAVVPDLQVNRSYTFTVATKNSAGNYGAESAATSPALSPTRVLDQLTITGARYRAGNEFRVSGTINVTGRTVTVYAVDPSLPANSTNQGIAGLRNLPTTAAVAPLTGATFEGRLRAPLPANPGRIWVKSFGAGVNNQRSGVAGPFTVS